MLDIFPVNFHLILSVTLSLLNSNGLSGKTSETTETIRIYRETNETRRNELKRAPISAHIFPEMDETTDLHEMKCNMRNKGSTQLLNLLDCQEKNS